MSAKFTSKIDSTGRFVIPKKILKDLNWNDITTVEVTSNETEVIITKSTKKHCKICNNRFPVDYSHCPYCGVLLCEEKE